MIPETEDTLATLDEPSTDMHAAEPDMSLDVILDVPVTLSLEVGRTRMPIRNLLQLTRARWWNWSAAPANRWTCSSTAR